MLTPQGAITAEIRAAKFAGQLQKRSTTKSSLQERPKVHLLSVEKRLPRVEILRPFRDSTATVHEVVSVAQELISGHLRAWQRHTVSVS